MNGPWSNFKIQTKLLKTFLFNFQILTWFLIRKHTIKENQQTKKCIDEMSFLTKFSKIKNQIIIQLELN